MSRARGKRTTRQLASGALTPGVSSTVRGAQPLRFLQGGGCLLYETPGWLSPCSWLCSTVITSTFRQWLPRCRCVWRTCAAQAGWQSSQSGRHVVDLPQIAFPRTWETQPQIASWKFPPIVSRGAWCPDCACGGSRWTGRGAGWGGGVESLPTWATASSPFLGPSGVSRLPRVSFGVDQPCLPSASLLVTDLP